MKKALEERCKGLSMKYVWLVGLTLAAWEDVRYRQISIFVLFFLGVFGLWNLYEAWNLGVSVLGQYLAAASIGIVMLLLSKATEGALGDGDGLFFLVSACYLMLDEIIILFLGSLEIACIWGMVLFLKKRRNTTIPFLSCAWPVGMMIAWMQ